MALPKLYQNLQQIPEKILERFTQYLQSPFFHSHEETLELWMSLRLYSPHFEVSDKDLYCVAFPEKTYDNSRLRVLRSYLYNHLENFLQHLELEARQKDRNRLLRVAAFRYSLPQLNKAAWEPIGNPIYWEPEDAYDEFVLRRDRLRNEVKGANRHSILESKVLEPLDSFYVIQRLKYLCVLAEPITNSDPIMLKPEIELVFDLYKQFELHQQPLAAIYFHLLRLYVAEDPNENLENLDKLLDKFREQLDPNEVINIYTIWFNYLNQQYRAGAKEGLRKIFELYKKMITLSCFFELGSFSAKHFLNVSCIATNLKEFEWAKSFLDENEVKLVDPWRQSIFAYCYGFWLFSQGLYTEAKLQLLDVEMLDTSLKIMSQLLLLKIYFESNDFEGMESIRMALKTFLYRNKEMTKVNKLSVSNFLRFSSRIFNYKNGPRSSNALAKLALEISNCEPIQSRSWLEHKLEELQAG